MNEQNQNILNLLAEIKDPEIPAVNIVELGIIRKVENINNEIQIEITPTYSGCPAMRLIEDEIILKLNSKGFTNVNISTVYSPVWSTEWMSDETKAKLKDYGIAPPGRLDENSSFPFPSTLEIINCPFCNSGNTEIRSPFGSTSCKSLYFCNSCNQPFEHFKCI